MNILHKLEELIPELDLQLAADHEEELSRSGVVVPDFASAWGIRS